MIVAIHQPEYLPWLGYVNKVKRADTFVLLDDVQFNRASLQQRAKVVRQGRVGWLSIPFVHAREAEGRQRICDVKIADPTWRTRHAIIITAAYGNAPHFRQVWDRLAPFYQGSDDSLARAVTDSAILMLQGFGVDVGKIVRASDVGAEGVKGERVLDICRRLDATHYLSGRTGAGYLDHAAFAAAGIEIVVQDFGMPVYRVGQPEEAGLSSLDAWAYLGDEKVRELV